MFGLRAFSQLRITWEFLLNAPSVARVQCSRGAKRRRSFLTAGNQIGAVFYLLYY